MKEMIISPKWLKISSGIVSCFLLILAICLIGNSGEQAASVNKHGELDSTELTWHAPGDDDLRFAFEWSPTTTEDQLSVPVYMKTEPTTKDGRGRPYVVVQIKNVKTGSSRDEDLRAEFNGGNYPTGGVIWAKNTGHNPNFRVFLSKDEVSGTWKGEINGNLAGNDRILRGNFLHFTIELIDYENYRDQGYVGYGGKGSKYNTGHKTYPAKNPAQTYNLYMATPCDIKEATESYVLLHDLDSGLDDNNYKRISIQLIKESPKGEKFIGPTESLHGRPGTGQQGTYEHKITFEPGWKYVLKVKNIVPTNILSFELPYDNISYKVLCKNYNLHPKASANSRPTPIGGVVRRVSAAIKNDGPTESEQAAYTTTRFIVKKDKWQRFHQRWHSEKNTNLPDRGTGSNPARWGCLVVGRLSNESDPSGSYQNQQNPHNALVDAREGNCHQKGFDVASSEKPGGVVFQPPTPSFSGQVTTLNNASDEHSAKSDGIGLGDRICYVTVVNRYTHNHGGYDWRASAPACVKVAKSPKVHIKGGDVIAGGRLTSSKVNLGTTTYTNFGEFATFSGDSVGNFRSNGGNTIYGDEHPLTFANASPTKGCFFLPTCTKSPLSSKMKTNTILNYASNFAKNNTFTDGSRTVEIGRHSFEVRKNRGIGQYDTLGTGPRFKIIVSNSPIKIEHNIVLPSSSRRVSNAVDLRQVIILAPKIEISKSVSRVDAWLVAQPDLAKVNPSSSDDGVIDTCYEQPGANAKLYVPQSSDDNKWCDGELEVNGPVIARKIYLKRTHGSDSVNNQHIPAETFNLPPETYAVLRDYSTFSNSAIQTTYIEEVAPRY